METANPNPFPITEGHFKGNDLSPKPFKYYRQSLDGSSDEWAQIVTDLSKRPTAIIALILGRELIWSREAPAHMVLEAAIGAEHWDAKIEGFRGLEFSSKPILAIFTNDVSLHISFRDYLLRSGVVPGMITVEGSTYNGIRQPLF